MYIHTRHNLKLRSYQSPLYPNGYVPHTKAFGNNCELPRQLYLLCVTDPFDSLLQHVINKQREILWRLFIQVHKKLKILKQEQ